MMVLSICILFKMMVPTANIVLAPQRKDLFIKSCEQESNIVSKTMFSMALVVNPLLNDNGDMLLDDIHVVLLPILNSRLILFL